MNREERLLSAILQNREAYNTLAPLVKEGVFSRHVQLVWDTVDTYYQADAEAKAVSRDTILDIITLNHPKHEQHFTHLLAGLERASVPNTVAEYSELHRQKIEAEIAEAVLNGDKKDVIDKLIEKRELCEIHEKTDEDSTLINASLKDALTIVAPENVIRVSPRALAQRLDGGLLRATQSVIYAVTEVGKSLLSIEITCGLLRDGRTVVYCGNEDPARSMLMRIYSNLSSMTKKEMIESPAEAERSAQEQGFSNLVFLNLSPGTVPEIRRAVERYKPDVLIVDQMANLDSGNSLTKVEKNEYLATQFRNIAKKYDVATIMVHQAGDSAHNKPILDKNDLYFSNTGVQGQMDVMIGLGMTQDMERDNKRMITLTKNKISADHSSFPITVDPLTSSVVE
jgi:archaellum biogenesis ATPase FlaH